MADVVDVITRLTYEANLSPLEKAIGLNEKNVNTIVELIAKQMQLEKELNSSNKQNVANVQNLTKAIQQLEQQYNKEIATIQKQLNQNTKLTESLKKQLATYDQVKVKQTQFTQGTNSAGLALLNFGRIAQDAPFGILGISNNINPALESFQRLKAETGSTGTALKALGSSLIGAGGIGFAVSVVTSLLVVFGDKLFNSGDQAEKAAEKQKKHTESIKSLNKELTDAIKNQSDLDKINSDRQNKGADAAKREADALKARGAAEEEIFAKEQEARQKEAQEVQNRISLLATVEDQIKGIFEESQHLSSELLQTQTPEEFRVSQILSILINRLGLSVEEGTEIATNAAKSFANRSAISKLVEKEIVKLNEEIKDITNQIAVATDARRKSIDELEVKDFDESYADALAQIERDAQLKLLYDEHLQLIDSQIATEQEILKLRQESRLNQGVNVSKEQLEAEKKTAEFEIKRLEFFRQMTVLSLEIAKEKEKIALAEKKGSEQDRIIAQLRINELISQRENLFSQRPQDLMNRVNPSYLDGFNRQDLIDSRAGGTKADPRTDAQKLKRPDFELKIQEDQFKKEQESYKKHLREVVKVYQSFEQAVSQILNDISKRQIEALDREVDVRTERVRQAEKLAERGNTEVLRLETERLEASEKLRRDAAQRQIATNAALALSNAIVAVATTAAESGVASIATIPAVLAALVAGYSFVRSLDNNTGFKDGVIDLQGPGTERSDSIPARLSKGESVMTAEATKRYKPLLEAMNDGRLPYTAERTGLNISDKKTARKLDQIIEAIEGNHVSVKQTMDQNGLLQVVETEKRREARRWGN